MVLLVHYGWESRTPLRATALRMERSWPDGRHPPGYGVTEGRAPGGNQRKSMVPVGLKGEATSHPAGLQGQGVFTV